MSEIPLGDDFVDDLDLSDFHPEEITRESPGRASTLDRTPIIHGTRAETGPDTFRRKWKPKRVPWSAPVVPEPDSPAVYLGPEDEEMMPPNARKLAVTAHLAGWLTLVSFAVGPVLATDGSAATDDIMGEDEGFTPTGRPKTKKVGEVPRPQQPTIMVRAVRSREAVARCEPDSLFMGMWLGGDYTGGRWIGAGWERGVIVYPWRSVDWRTLWERFDAIRSGARQPGESDAGSPGTSD
jgi:hypothetical protein